MVLLLIRSFIKRETLVSARKLIRAIKTYFLMDRREEAEQLTLSIDPPPFDPLKPSLPVSFPIKKLEDLESRSYFKSFHFPFNKASVPLQSGSSLPARPRTLVCHDMAGGYIDDKWIQGGTNADAYAIWHWYLIDVFVYFSHSLVTLPPPCWTNAAHTHGVKVLGTFITEWDEGRVISSKILSTKETAQMYAERLTELAVTLGFDGWLINMEVNLDLGQIPNLKEFVSHLTKTMHSALPGSLVIWYDSVTKDGDLTWQNQLNENNKPFFDLCDGIFVNYSWQVNYPKLSAAVAGERKFDVYMGIDVFGRGTYGGGQWNTNVALDVLKKDDVSAAIFAPGWVYETKQPPDFQTAQNRWWGLVEKSWGLVQNYPKGLPFYSNFDQGRGYHFSVDGEQVSSDPWCNISCQSFQPALEISGDPSPNAVQVLVDFKGASYGGGGNVTFKGTLEDNAHVMTRLFPAELLCGELPIHITYSVRSDGSSLLGLGLQFSSTTNDKTSVLLASWGRTLPTMNQFSSKFSRVIMPNQVRKLERDGPTTPTWTLLECSMKMSGYTLTEIQAVCYKSRSENKRRQEQTPSSGNQTATSAYSLSEYFAVLGHITVKTSDENSDFPPSSSWVVEGQYITWTSGAQGAKILNVKLVWKLKDGDDSLFSKYIIYVEKQPEAGDHSQYLGVARVEAFYVSNLTVPSGTSSLKFTIQVCGADGTCQKLADSPTFQLTVEGS